MMIRCGIGLLFLLVSGGASYDSVETKYSFTENYAEFAKAVENPDATLAELKTKCEIFAAGCAKHDKKELAAQYLILPQKYISNK